MYLGTRWHDSTCAAPRLSIDKCNKDIWCQTCSSCPHLDQIVANLTAVSPCLSVPEDESEEMNLFWPPSVPYTRSYWATSLAGDETNVQADKCVRKVALVDQVSTSPIYTRCLQPGEFRLVHLDAPLNGDVDSPVHAELKTYTHDDCPEYETVSYTWGGEEDDSIPCKPIFIGPYWDVLLQTKNCWDMLKLMRPSSGQRVVWVDAISINQSNQTERADQVAKMGRIYEDSMRVFVFLGSDVIHPIGNALYPTRRKLHHLSREPMNSDQEGTSQPVVFDLGRLLKRRYFSRIWVVQEMILSRQATIRIGSSDYWVDHRTSRDIAKKDPTWNWDSTAAPWFQHANQRHLTAEDRNSLLEMIRLTWKCQSTDPRDKVFGILGLDHSEPPIRPDYSISAQHAFIGIFAHCLINLRDTRVFSWASGIHGGSNYPSWIPAWKSPTAFRESADSPSNVIRQWSLKWQREFVYQIDLYRFDMEKWRARARAPNERQFDRTTKKKGGYYQQYWLQEDSEALKANGDWDRDQFSVVQFLPIVAGPEQSEQRQINVEIAGGKYLEDTLGVNKSIERSEERPWYEKATVSAELGTLSLPLVHLQCIVHDPQIVSQMEGLTCYRVSTRPVEEDESPLISEASDSGEPSSDTTASKKPEMLDDGALYLFFTSRTTDLDEQIIAGEDHIFILDEGSAPPLFLILREIEAGIFTLVASCEELLFTYISGFDTFGGRPSSYLADAIRLRDIRKTRNLPEVFHSVASGESSGPRSKVTRYAWQLCHIFLGEPTFEDLLAFVQASNSEELLDVYVHRMRMYDPQHIHDTASKLRISNNVIEIRLSKDVWLHKVRLLWPLKSSQRVKTAFEWWRGEDDEWRQIGGEEPRESVEDIYIRAEVEKLLSIIESCLDRLNFFKLLEMIEAEEKSKTLPSSTSRKPFAETQAQSWSIPCLPDEITRIEEEFGFDGNCYQVQII
jgi:hypothetical protein